MPIPLSQLPVLVADGQTTGASPAHGHLLELGWAATSADRDLDELQVRSRLLSLPEGATIPRPVARLTGITPPMLDDAEEPARAWASLRAAVADGERTMVIHYARFELAFFRELHRAGGADDELPWTVVCTHEIARRLLPDLPRRGLRALAGYLGHGVDALKRSAEHVRATAFVWQHLVHRLADEAAVTTLEELSAWLERPAPRPSAKRAYPMDRATRLALPDTPGVYRMLRTSGELLYVGKARSLRDRVNGYFRQHRGVADRTLEMLTQATKLDVTPTASALEAALLENDEIKARSPPYNVMLRPEGRAVWHATASLDSWRDAPDRRHRRGPFASRALLEALAALTKARPDEPPPAALASACGFDDTLELDVWREGLGRFIDDVLDGSKVESRRALARAGARIWTEQRRASDLDDPEVEEEEMAPEAEPEEWAWDPPRIAAALERITSRGAHEQRRAAWLTRLVESSVGWARPDGRLRALVLEQGTVVRRLDLDSAEALPVPPGLARRPRERRACVDVVTFDRLRVLTSELRRVLADGRDAWVRTGEGPPLHPERLGRALWWV